MVVGVCGLGYTGSGAVIDLLKEYSGIKVLDEMEFPLIYQPDGFEDLFYHINNPSRYFKSDVAIERFYNKIHQFFNIKTSQWKNINKTEVWKLTDDYLSSICQVEWKGMWGYDIHKKKGLELFVYRIVFKLLRMYGKYFYTFYRRKYYRTMHLSIKPENFIISSKNYLYRLFDIVGYPMGKEGITVYNQLFSGDRPANGFKFFDDAKAIIVDKDPRDLYVLLKKEIHIDGSWMPTDNVEDFIVYYKRIREYADYSDTNNILVISFEDLIYEYNKTVSEIEKFLGIKQSTHSCVKEYFKPNKSINNTQLFRKYPELLPDITRIEAELKAYLYPFDNYPTRTVFGKSF